jgi:hypothetical protein
VEIRYTFICQKSRLSFIGHVKSLENKRKVIEVLNNTPRGSRLRGRPKTDGGIVYKQILINAELHIRKRVQRTELTERSPLRRRRSALDRSAI